MTEEGRIEAAGHRYRNWREFAAADPEALTYQSSTDGSAYDRDPDACWRCDSRRATTDVGLCDPCRAAL